MADKNIVKNKRAERRRLRVRGKIQGTAERPRLAVSKSLSRVFAQIIDDENSTTLIGIDSTSKVLASELSGKQTKTDAARKVGEAVARLAKDKGIEQVVFDRTGSPYHGRIKAVADGAREGGLKF